LQTTVR